MDDYHRMLRQVDYCIGNVDVNHRLLYDNRKKLNKSPVYKTILKAIKIMLEYAFCELRLHKINISFKNNIISELNNRYLISIKPL